MLNRYIAPSKHFRAVMFFVVGFLSLNEAVVAQGGICSTNTIIVSKGKTYQPTCPPNAGTTTGCSHQNQTANYLCQNGGGGNLDQAQLAPNKCPLPYQTEYKGKCYNSGCPNGYKLTMAGTCCPPSGSANTCTANTGCTAFEEKNPDGQCDKKLCPSNYILQLDGSCIPCPAGQIAFNGQCTDNPKPPSPPSPPVSNPPPPQPPVSNPPTSGNNGGNTPNQIQCDPGKVPNGSGLCVCPSGEVEYSLQELMVLLLGAARAAVKINNSTMV